MGVKVLIVCGHVFGSGADIPSATCSFNILSLQTWTAMQLDVRLMMTSHHYLTDGNVYLTKIFAKNFFFDWNI